MQFHNQKPIASAIGFFLCLDRGVPICYTVHTNVDRSRIIGGTAMDTFNHWVVRHKYLVSIALTVILCGGYTALLVNWKAPLWTIFAIDLLFFILSWLYPTACQNTLIARSAQPLFNACDPYPLLHETEELLQYCKSGIARQELQINHCLALGEIGELQKALEGMRAINIDKYAGMPQIDKYAYYNNLACFSEALGDPQTANICVAKAKQIYADIKNSKLKRKYAQLEQFNTAETYFKNGEHSKALEILHSITPEHALRGVEIAMLQGLIYRDMGDVENAKANFAYVIRNGNKLHKVTVARQHLIELQSK